MKIAVFDSGAGGLASLARLRNLGIAREIFYYADIANLPFGSKSAAELERIILRDVAEIFDAGAELIVVACNTACTVLPNSPRLCKISDFTARVVAAHPDALLLCTQATLASGIYAARYAAAAPELVLCAQNADWPRAKQQIARIIAEQKTAQKVAEKVADLPPISARPVQELFGFQSRLTVAQRCLKNSEKTNCSIWNNARAKLIAGCTHFGLLRPEFAALGLNLLDPVDLFEREMAAKFERKFAPKEVILHFNEASMEKFFKEHQCRF